MEIKCALISKQTWVDTINENQMISKCKLREIFCDVSVCTLPRTQCVRKWKKKKTERKQRYRQHHRTMTTIRFSRNLQSAVSSWPLYLLTSGVTRNSNTCIKMQLVACFSSRSEIDVYEYNRALKKTNLEIYYP